MFSKVKTSVFFKFQQDETKVSQKKLRKVEAVRTTAAWKVASPGKTKPP